METCTVQELGSFQNLVIHAYAVDEPVVVFDGEDECLVAMRPSVFERILFDVERFDGVCRQTLRL